jgi:chromate reductase
MPDSYRVGMLIGSLRKDAYSRKLGNALQRLAPASLAIETIEFGDLPLYNQDIEDSGDLPHEWESFREAISRCDGLLFVTPEYNRSVPGGLKNAIDVGSRPYGKSAWEKRPAAVASISPGAIGAFGANHHLRQSLVFLDVPVMPQPEAYVGGAADLFDDRGELTKEDTRKFLASFMQAFADWVAKNARRTAAAGNGHARAPVGAGARR